MKINGKRLGKMVQLLFDLNNEAVKEGWTRSQLMDWIKAALTLGETVAVFNGESEEVKDV